MWVNIILIQRAVCCAGTQLWLFFWNGLSLLPDPGNGYYTEKPCCSKVLHDAEQMNIDTFYALLRNTLLLSLMNIMFVFPMPIVVALLLNELRTDKLKKLIQTLIYIPHFMSLLSNGQIFQELIRRQRKR
jgi:ABC-type sugar transport system permease subunit